jgi:diguanylate cyclase (GGDEF)-like protein
MATRPDNPPGIEAAMAKTDPLTGLPNQRAWEEELRRELARSKRNGFPVSIALLHLDHPGFGDEDHEPLGNAALLHEAANAWRLAVRVCDLVARLRGRRFAVLFPECSGYAPQALQRLTDATPGGYTCCAGIAIWNGLEPAEELMARAAAALWEAKEDGPGSAVLAEY